MKENIRFKIVMILSCLTLASMLLAGACSKSTAADTSNPAASTSLAGQTIITSQPFGPVGVVSVTGPLPPLNPGGPPVQIVLKNTGDDAIVSLTASLDLGTNLYGNPYLFTFDVSASKPLAPGATTSARLTLINGSFSSDISYPLTIKAGLQEGAGEPQTTSITEEVRISPATAPVATLPPTTLATSPTVSVSASTPILSTLPVPPTNSTPVTTINSATATAPAALPPLKRPATDNFIVLNAGFVLVDPSAPPVSGQSGINYIPYGSIIIHWANGITEVFGTDGNRILIARDADAAQLPHPSGPNGPFTSPATMMLQVPNGAQVGGKDDLAGTTRVYLNSALILTIVTSHGSYPPA